MLVMNNAERVEMKVGVGRGGKGENKRERDWNFPLLKTSSPHPPLSKFVVVLCYFVVSDVKTMSFQRHRAYT